MSFIEYVSQKAIPVWQKCLETDFVQGIGKGTLEKERFKHYIIQDSIYLRNFARVLAMGIVKSSEISKIKAFYSLLTFVNSDEGDTRLNYLKEFGITEKEADKYPEHPSNKAYTDFMMECADKGNIMEILFSALPCMFSYYWTFTELVKEYPECRKGYYAPLINDYTDISYAQICKEWSDFADKLCYNISDKQKNKLCEIYLKSSYYELDFWNMEEGQ